MEKKEEAGVDTRGRAARKCVAERSQIVQGDYSPVGLWPSSRSTSLIIHFGFLLREVGVNKYEICHKDGDSRQSESQSRLRDRD